MTCPDCGKEFEDWRRLAGHRGGAHLRTVVMGRRHGNYRTRKERLAAIRHGTEAGYKTHRRLKDAACRPCKDAHSRYVTGTNMIQ